MSKNKLIMLSFLIVIQPISTNLKGQFSHPQTDTTEIKKSTIGISLGSFFFLTINLEVAYFHKFRICNNVSFQLSPSAGIMRQWYRSDGVGPPYHMAYLGGRGGLIIGNPPNKLELEFGGIYLYAGERHWGYKENKLLPSGSIAIRNLKHQWHYKIGIGFPKGLFGTLIF